MTDPLWDELDHLLAQVSPCADDDHDAVSLRTLGGTHVVTICTRCGAHLPDPDAEQ